MYVLVFIALECQFGHIALDPACESVFLRPFARRIQFEARLPELALVAKQLSEIQVVGAHFTVVSHVLELVGRLQVHVHVHQADVRQHLAISHKVGQIARYRASVLDFAQSVELLRHLHRLSADFRNQVGEHRHSRAEFLYAYVGVCLVYIRQSSQIDRHAPPCAAVVAVEHQIIQVHVAECAFEVCGKFHLVRQFAKSRQHEFQISESHDGIIKGDFQQDILPVQRLLHFFLAAGVARYGFYPRLVVISHDTVKPYLRRRHPQHEVRHFGLRRVRHKPSFQVNDIQTALLRALEVQYPHIQEALAVLVETELAVYAAEAHVEIIHLAALARFPHIVVGEDRVFQSQMVHPVIHAGFFLLLVALQRVYQETEVQLTVLLLFQVEHSAVESDIGHIKPAVSNQTPQIEASDRLGSVYHRVFALVLHIKPVQRNFIEKFYINRFYLYLCIEFLTGVCRSLLHKIILHSVILE